MHARKWIPSIALFAGLLLLPAMAAAQTAGSVIGRVYDPSKAAIPGATITAVNVATGESRVVASDQSGYYIFPSLPVGTYDLTAEAQGFRKQVTRGLVVDVAAALVVDFNLSLGEMSQLIEVVSEAPVIETRSAATGGIMENRQPTELPINGRDHARFSLLIPGALARGNYIADLSFNGQHTVHNQFSIDGIDASRVDQPYMANGFERGARLLTGSLDTISEFRVQTNSYGAQYGRAAGVRKPDPQRGEDFGGGDRRAGAAQRLALRMARRCSRQAGAGGREAEASDTGAPVPRHGNGPGGDA